MTITRFAPSPTGLLHIGSIRPALANYLFARKMSGKFILRIDDTDEARCSEYHKNMILQNLKWLGLEWDDLIYQSHNLAMYQHYVDVLVKQGRLYECFEDSAELSIKRKNMLANHRPPIYDRTSLRLSEEEKTYLKKQGKKPHYRFKINYNDIKWADLVRGDVLYKGLNISDPIVIRQDGSFTYLLCSVIDDIKCGITHVFRGEDHISNTAIQIQMFEALNAKIPEFGHLSLIKSKEDKISKRVGGFEILSLEKEGLEPRVINSFFAYLGTSKPVTVKKTLQELSDDFNISSFSLSPTFYNPEELWLLNHKFLSSLDFQEIAPSLINMGLQSSHEELEAFWFAIRNNINKLREAKNWWNIIHLEIDAKASMQFDTLFLKQALLLLPDEDFDKNTWSKWTANISKVTQKKGKELFKPLRGALTGLLQGPEMMSLLPLIGRDRAMQRIQKIIG